jgi:hypothetical protein
MAEESREDSYNNCSLGYNEVLQETREETHSVTVINNTQPSLIERKYCRQFLYKYAICKCIYVCVVCVWGWGWGWCVVCGMRGDTRVVVNATTRLLHIFYSGIDPPP